MSLKAAIPELRRPFTVAAVKFKPQSVLGDGKGVLCVAYIDARLVSERLNHVVPDDWTDAYRPVQGGLMWCDLTVCGVTRSDVGEGEGKALVSDALKRAAVRFGVGVSLYAIPQQRIWANQGKDLVSIWKSGTKGNGKDKYDARIEDAGHAHLAAQYGRWLQQAGTQAFGEPLDHGDIADSAGEPSPPMPTVDPVERHTSVDELDGGPALQLVPEEIIDAVAADATEAKAAGVDVRAVFKALGAEPQRAIKQTLRLMSPEQVEAFRSNLADLKAAA